LFLYISDVLKTLFQDYDHSGQCKFCYMCYILDRKCHLSNIYLCFPLDF